MNEVAKQSFDSLCSSVPGIIWLHITSDTVLWNASPLVRVSESTLEDWIASRREVMTSKQKGQLGRFQLNSDFSDTFLNGHLHAILLLVELSSWLLS